jgi:hypothetical protein
MIQQLEAMIKEDTEVQGESQNAEEQPSMLYWLWSWVFYFFNMGSIGFTLFFLFCEF